MEAKEIIELYANRGREILPHFMEVEVGQEIAEISFKAGQESREPEIEALATEIDNLREDVEKAKQAGIKEVVEWIKHHTNGDRLELISKFICISEIDWEVKLKEWEG